MWRKHKWMKITSANHNKEGTHTGDTLTKLEKILMKPKVACINSIHSAIPKPDSRFLDAKVIVQNRSNALSVGTSFCVFYCVTVSFAPFLSWRFLVIIIDHAHESLTSALHLLRAYKMMLYSFFCNKSIDRLMRKAWQCRERSILEVTRLTREAWHCGKRAWSIFLVTQCNP